MLDDNVRLGNEITNAMVCYNREPELMRQNIQLRMKLNHRMYWIVGLWIVSLVIASLLGYFSGQREAYWQQGSDAKKAGRPVTDWPYSDWNGAEFEWVVGWYEST